MSAPRNKEEDPGASLCSAGALAASILQRACKPTPEHEEHLMLEVVREAATDLENQLDALARSGGDGTLPPPLLAEGALRCADLANLAACALPSLPPERVASAVAVVHLAAGTVRAFVTLVRGSANGSTDANAGYAIREARGAGWRAGLAVRQVEGLVEDKS